MVPGCLHMLPLNMDVDYRRSGGNYPPIFNIYP